MVSAARAVFWALGVVKLAGNETASETEFGWIRLRGSVDIEKTNPK